MYVCSSRYIKAQSIAMSRCRMSYSLDWKSHFIFVIRELFFCLRFFFFFIFAYLIVSLNIIQVL